ncbi:MAG: hypothetical protein JKY95_16815 [Planctomycetaceae bacterium]|nr:hypothetical protein [Planctomycetaceae bacterium]
MSYSHLLRFFLLLFCFGLFGTFQNALVAGKVITVLGTGIDGFSGDGGAASQAKCGGPFGVVIGPDKALYVCETTNHIIRRIDLKTGVATTVAGCNEKGYSGDGGKAVDAKLNEPYEIRFTRNGDMYFVEMVNNIVRKVDHQTSIITTVAGTGQKGYHGDNGPATKAHFNRPHSIAFDAEENLYICDIGNHRVRVVDADTGIVTTFAGTGKKGPNPESAKLPNISLSGPRALAFDGKHLWLALREGNAVYKIDLNKKMLFHIAGTGGKAGYKGDGGPAKQAVLAGPKGIAIDNKGNIFLADTESHTIRRIDAQTGIITTLVGNGKKGDGPDGDPGSCKLNRPHGVYVADDGRVFIGDSSNHRVRCWIP